jgi:NADPH-dependent FMN reductase
LLPFQWRRPRSKVRRRPFSGEIATVGAQERAPVSFLVFSESVREGLLNTRLVELAADAIETNGGTVDFGSMVEFDCRSYKADVQRDRGFPAGAEELRGRLEASDAFVICSPEYSASMPGVLKNAVDWVSRLHPQPFYERHALLLSASPSMVGGNRQMRAPRCSKGTRRDQMPGGSEAIRPRRGDARAFPRQRLNLREAPGGVRLVAHPPKPWHDREQIWQLQALTGFTDGVGGYVWRHS